MFNITQDSYKKTKLPERVGLIFKILIGIDMLIYFIIALVSVKTFLFDS